MTNNGGHATLTGRYVFVPNPCTTRPCLPGMAYAVESGGQFYFLTQSDRWSDQARAWGGWTPVPGNKITVVGRISKRTDIRGDAFLTIEVESLKPID